MKNTQIWLASHLYYEGDLQKLLLDAVEPFIRKVMDQKQANSFFFIRYWDKGSHIRLRFKGFQHIVEKKLQPGASRYFSEYFTKHPSVRGTNYNLADYPDAHTWYANDSVHFLPYEPETDRYGGAIGVLIAEQQFEVSSRTVLKILQTMPSPTDDSSVYDRLMGAAIQLHVGLAYCLQMQKKEAKDFFERVYKAWFHRAFTLHKNQTEQLQANEQQALEIFEKRFYSQKQLLVPYINTLWSVLEKNIEFEDEWMNQWLTQMQQICCRLKDAFTHGTLQCPSQNYFQYETNAMQKYLYPIIESYIHMTNNRLGIINRDESFIAFLIYKSLSLTNA